MLIQKEANAMKSNMIFVLILLHTTQLRTKGKALQSKYDSIHEYNQNINQRKPYVFHSMDKLTLFAFCFAENDDCLLFRARIFNEKDLKQCTRLVLCTNNFEQDAYSVLLEYNNAKQ